MGIYINCIETSSPQCKSSQEEIYNFITQFQDDRRYKLLIKQAIRKSGIENRYSVVKDLKLSTTETELFHRNENKTLHNPSTSERNNIYKKNSGPLAFKAISKISNKINLQEITHIITVSCTGFYNPGLDIEIINEFNLNKNIERVNIGFMGCQAAFPALKTASEFCKSNKDAKVLVVCIEMCTLHMKLTDDLNYIIGNSIFSDGCAACIVSSDEKLTKTQPFLEVKSFNSHVINDDGKNLAWKIGDNGFDLTLNSDLPSFISENINQALEHILEIENSIDCWAIHPGGRAILDSFQKFKPDADLKHSRSILKQYGNMSSPTILFVLKEILENRTKSEKNIFSATFGPGITVESSLLEIVL